jgi:RNA polymerase sigma-70 factor (ECF subfamily)
MNRQQLHTLDTTAGGPSWENKETSFHQGLVQLRPRLRARALVLLGDEAEADDAVQETYFRALQSARRMLAEEVPAWLMAILRNVIVDRWRAKRHVAVTELGDEHLRFNPDEAAEVALWRSVTDDQVRQAIEQLPNHLREVVERRYLHRLSNRAIARGLGTKESTLGTRLHRARERLKTMLLARLAEEGSVAALHPSS